MRNAAGFLLVAIIGTLISRRAEAQLMEERRPFTRAAKETEKLSESVRFCTLNAAARIAERTLLEVFETGQLQATAQLIRLCVGEPGVFMVPLYFLAGAEAATLGASDAPERAAASLLMPTAGAFNVQLANANRVVTWGKYSELSIAYQAGVRYTRLPVMGSSDQAVAAFGGDLDIGFRFQTGAWDLSDPSIAGILWAQGKIGVHLLADDRLRKAFGPQAKDPSVISLEAGVVIGDRVNVKFGWYRVLNNDWDTASSLKQDLVKVGFDIRAKQAPALERAQ